MGRVKELLEDEEEAERSRWDPVISPYKAKERAYLDEVASRPFDPQMSDREMLYWLQAKLYEDRMTYLALRAYGGPREPRLHGYIAGVLGGYAMRVDPRIRAILTAMHNGVRVGEMTLPPPGPVEYHPGRPPPYKQQRAAREAKAAARAAAKPPAE
ncbi:hypothetical protein [Methylorubrum extorquens]|uniref:hypothetical protein n=1 Tax=Methylorubrum extorquens TaxID=408 RepID=UPI0011BEB8E2|nr:hypothetical protein [Methylorubrum extorquens]